MVSTKALMALTIVFTALVVIIVSVRLWARRKSRLPLGVDDVCAVIAAVGHALWLAVPLDLTSSSCCLSLFTRYPSLSVSQQHLSWSRFAEHKSRR